MRKRAVVVSVFHVIWATKRRAPVLAPRFDDELEAILEARCAERRCVLLALGCGPDHVHVLVRLDPTVALAPLVRHLKGGSAYEARRHPSHPVELTWQRGYWAQSISASDVDRAMKYVRSQRLGHDVSPKDAVSGRDGGHPVDNHALGRRRDEVE